MIEKIKKEGVRNFLFALVVLVGSIIEASRAGLDWTLGFFIFWSVMYLLVILWPWRKV